MLMLFIFYKCNFQHTHYEIYKFPRRPGRLQHFRCALPRQALPLPLAAGARTSRRARACHKRPLDMLRNKEAIKETLKSLSMIDFLRLFDP